MSPIDRSVSVTETLAGGVPETLVPVFVVLTFLGSTWFVTTVGPAVYLFGPKRGWLSRRDGARLLAVSIGALALVVLAKGLFAEPRPPESVMRIAEDGNGFPSGHATGAAAFYGGLAALLDVNDRARRYAAAAGMIALVAFTRLVLGVHYLGDVVAGALLGTAFVAGLLALTRRRIGYGFVVAAVTAVAAVVLVGPTEDPVAALGGTVGALVGWWLVTRRGALLNDVPVKAAAPILVVLGGAAALTLKVDAVLPAIGVAHAVAGVAFVALPVLRQ
ncbi:phosphatase PAP2 family protein [Halobacterium noricense]|uniref:phosphatase PAP2 family protein n=1 Tax=Halobacterium noricense TaxID=223182 RepID=UPI001E5272BB|nr:phosphatase PAP2 family protein [Halobacterium noricense]UHH25029.1 phosphatase PAP2 family protein [Halobacterium noricense]